MKHLISILFLFISVVTFSQNLIDNQWQFSTGDSLIWKDASFNSSKWATIKSGRIWEEQGFANYDGFAWYRKTVVIPEELQKDASKFGGFSLYLGAIDDADQVFFNGKLIGETGIMPPNYVGAYDKLRKYEINSPDIQWGKENLIAVRVFDSSGGGGITGEDVSLKVRGLDSKFAFQLQFPRENRLFFNDEKVELPFSINNSSNYHIEGEIQFTILSDFKDTISVWRESVKIPARKTRIVKIDRGNLAPGFYTLYIELTSKLLNYSKSYNFGVDPEKIISPANKEPDFDNFWMRAKRELAAVDPQFRLIHNDSLSTAKLDVYLVEMRSLGNLLVRGWYSRPKARGKYPAILQVQGYGSNPTFYRGYPGDDMAEFLLNIRGFGNSRDEIKPGGTGYILQNLKDEERYIYRGAYMDCVRAIDFLCSREEVDSRYLVVTGGSQGGALSIATAALDNQRIKLCIPSVPFLSDFPDYFKVAKWPANEFVVFEKANHDFGWKNIYKNLSYFDVKNLAPWVRCPVFMGIGLLDTTCPPHINFAAYNQMNVPKSYIAYPESGHGLPSDFAVKKYEWMKKELEKLKH